MHGCVVFAVGKLSYYSTGIIKATREFYLKTSLVTVYLLAEKFKWPPRECQTVMNAFDTIEYSILVHRLHTDLVFTNSGLQWFSSYLTDRTQYVSVSSRCCVFAQVHSGVLQGSVHGPMLFTMHIKTLSTVIDSHSVMHYAFADDLELQMSSPN